MDGIAVKETMPVAKIMQAKMSSQYDMHLF
jgi:hypothetical protein